MSLVANSIAALRRGAATVSNWRLRTKIIAGSSALLIVLIALWLGLRSGGCTSREDVEARVAALSSALQADAASGNISVEELATRIKKMNASATAFETSKDLGAYCEALDALDDEFRQ